MYGSKGKVCFQYLLFIEVFLNFIGVQTLRNVNVVVPHVVKTFDTVTLRCEFDLENQPLYTVKWYKGRDEIFRYIPREMPNTRTFSLPLVHMDIDINRSSQNQIVLRHVSPELTGRYKCEVSTDAPNFETIPATGFMYVVDLPQGDIELKVEKRDNGHGQLISANCTTPPSFPPMNITWFLNGIKIKPQTFATIPKLLHSKGKRVALATTSYIETELDETFQPATSNMVRIQCIASLFHLYRKEKVEYIEDDRPKPSRVLGIQGKTSGSFKQEIVSDLVPAVLLSLYFVR